MLFLKKMVAAKSLKRRSWNCLVKRRQRNVTRIMSRRMEFPWLQIAARFAFVLFFFHIAPYVMMFFVIQCLSSQPLACVRLSDSILGTYKNEQSENKTCTTWERGRWRREKCLSPAPARFSHFLVLNDFPPPSRSLEQATQPPNCAPGLQCAPLLAC